MRARHDRQEHHLRTGRAPPAFLQTRAAFCRRRARCGRIQIERRSNRNGRIYGRPRRFQANSTSPGMQALRLRCSAHTVPGSTEAEPNASPSNTVLPAGVARVGLGRESRREGNDMPRGKRPRPFCARCPSAAECYNRAVSRRPQRRRRSRRCANGRGGRPQQRARKRAQNAADRPRRARRVASGETAAASPVPRQSQNIIREPRTRH